MSLSSHAALSRVGFAGNGRNMLVLEPQVATAARCDLPVLIIAESDVDREAIARAIHHRSRRASGPFIAINCDAVSETQLELELFGYHRGAFAGANRNKRGLLEIAHRGTLFLNQVGKLSAVSQARLLRVLTQAQFQPCGSLVQKEFKGRLISGTDHNLEELMLSRFREALFYSLAVLMIRMPSLHERPHISLHAKLFIADSFREFDSLDHYLDRTLLGAYDHFRALTGSHSATARLFRVNRVALYKRIARAKRRINGDTAPADVKDSVRQRSRQQHSPATRTMA